MEVGFFSGRRKRVFVDGFDRKHGGRDFLDWREHTWEDVNSNVGGLKTGRGRRNENILRNR